MLCWIRAQHSLLFNPLSFLSFPTFSLCLCQSLLSLSLSLPPIPLYLGLSVSQQRRKWNLLTCWIQRRFISWKRKVTRSTGPAPHLLYCNSFGRVYLSHMQPFVHRRLCHAVHMLTLLPPTEMPHQGEAFSRAHINLFLLVAWEMLEYIHLWGLFLERHTKLGVWPCLCFTHAVPKMLNWQFLTMDN